MIDYDNTPCYQVFPFDDHLDISMVSPAKSCFSTVVKTEEKQTAENPRADLHLNQEKNGWPGAAVTQIGCRGGEKKVRMRHR